MQHAQGRAAPIFVIVLDEVLVAHDISQVIRDLYADATIIFARPLDANLPLPDGPIMAAFVQDQVPMVFHSDLGKRLRRDGGRLVVVGHDADKPTEDFLVLPVPFTQRDVAALLAGIAG
jgi:hypothetical protein